MRSFSTWVLFRLLGSQLQGPPAGVGPSLSSVQKHKTRERGGDASVFEGDSGNARGHPRC